MNFASCVNYLSFKAVNFALSSSDKSLSASCGAVRN